MSFKASILLVFVVNVVIAARPLKDHEVYSTCTSNCPVTCDNYENPPDCIQSCGPAGYECESGYIRRSDGECVLASECPGPHEIYTTCSSNCPVTCDNYQTPPMCIQSCETAGYECESGYIRRNDGACVLESEC